MAVLSLFGNATSTRAAGRGRVNDIGRLSRERRLAFYLGACQALGLNPQHQPLRFVRCDDGRLRLHDPSRIGAPVRRLDAGAALPARLERELDSAAAAIASGGGISYGIDLETGDLRVHEVVRAQRL